MGDRQARRDTLGGKPTRRGRGWVRRRAGERIQIGWFFPHRISPRYGVFLVHGNASYTRCCNDAVHPLDGDVVGVTEVLDCCGFAARFGALEPEVKLQVFRLGASVLDDGWRSLSLG